MRSSVEAQVSPSRKIQSSPAGQGWSRESLIYAKVVKEMAFSSYIGDLESGGLQENL
jgi:hypothetical protein